MFNTERERGIEEFLLFPTPMIVFAAALYLAMFGVIPQAVGYVIAGAALLVMAIIMIVLSSGFDYGIFDIVMYLPVLIALFILIVGIAGMLV